MIKDLTDVNFDLEISQSKTPIIIDFYAVWCSPCSLIAPLIEEVAEEYEGKITVFKANVEDCPDATQKFNIASIPAIFFLDKNKEVANQIIGSTSKEVLIQKVNEIIKS
jgi:thioredoxin 1